MKSKRKMKTLQLLSAIGFTGKVVGGLHLQEDGGLVYPVGVGVGVWDRRGSNHAILHAHTRPVTALAVSRSGQLIVSAQNSDPGCQAVVVVWRYGDRQEVGRYGVHREEVASVGVSSCGGSLEEYVVSLGGALDGYLVIWHVPTKRPICSVQAGEPGLGTASLLCTAPLTPTVTVVGGEKLLRVWSLHPPSQRLTPTTISLGLLERNYTCLQIDEEEQFLYAASTCGDVVKVRLNMTSSGGSGAVLVSVMAPRPPSLSANKLTRPPSPGIQALVLLKDGLLLAGDVGGGLRAYRQLHDLGPDGRPASLAPPLRAHGTLKYTHPKDPTRPLLQQLWAVEVGSAITSVGVVGGEVIIGTVSSEIYSVRLAPPPHQYNRPPSHVSKGNWRKTERICSGSTGKTDKDHGRIGNSGKTERIGSGITGKTDKDHGSSGNGKRGNGSAIKVTVYGADERTNSKNKGRTKNEGRIQRTSGFRNEGLCWAAATPEVELLSTCHSDPIYDVTFPRGMGELVVSGGVGGVRVWNVRSLEEVLRVELPGLVCGCCCLTYTLHTIVTGWSDGRLRGLGAETGRVVWTVDEAHYNGVNAVVTLPTPHVVSGGRDGRVRVWVVDGTRVSMVSSQKDHRGEVTHLSLSANNNTVLSCSGDGSCVLWRLPDLERLYRLRAHTVFLGGCILSCGEVVTTGSDGALMVWDRQDGALLAELIASQRPITCIAATGDDATIVTAGEDAIVRVWNWRKGRVTHEGRGHSGAITRSALSPDGSVLVTAGKDGALLFWLLP